jgi:hypothetical protein
MELSMELRFQNNSKEEVDSLIVKAAAASRAIAHSITAGSSHTPARNSSRD